MDDQKDEGHEHDEHPGCKCGGVCKITGDCGKHLLKGEEKPEAEKVTEEKKE